MDRARGQIKLLATSWNARWWIVGAGVMLFLGGGWMMRQYFVYVLAGNTGPMSLRADWPPPLKDVLDAPDGIEIDESTIKVHCLCQGFDPEFVWRMDAALGFVRANRKTMGTHARARPQVVQAGRLPKQALGRGNAYLVVTKK